MSSLKILYVDDDEGIIKNIQRLIPIIEGNHGVTTATSAREAIDILKKDSAHYFAIFSDERMPVQSGNELLQYVRKQWPMIERVMISATDDVHSVQKALNTSGVSTYLAKPVSKDRLQIVIKKCFDTFQQKLSTNITEAENRSALLGDIMAWTAKSTSLPSSALEHYANACRLYENQSGQNLKHRTYITNKMLQYTLCSQVRQNLSEIGNQLTNRRIPPPPPSRCQNIPVFENANILEYHITLLANARSCHVTDIIKPIESNLYRLNLGDEYTYTNFLSPELLSNRVSVQICVETITIATICIASGIEIYYSHDSDANYMYIKV